METLVIKTKSKSDTKALKAFASALMLEVYSAKEAQDIALANYLKECKKTGLVGLEKTKVFFNNLGK